MPTYEYHCDTCGADFEVFAKTMNAPTPTCAKCDDNNVSRKLSVFGVSGNRPDPPSGGCPGCAQGGSCPMSQR